MRRSVILVTACCVFAVLMVGFFELLDRRSPALVVPLVTVQVPINVEKMVFSIKLCPNDDLDVTLIKADCSCVTSLNVPVQLKAGVDSSIEVEVDLEKLVLPCEKQFIFYTNPPMQSPVVSAVRFVQSED